ncbi:hypothetical protein T492DRAFT_390117 [Pavlovales sp. CCMP2436]|nr:hypothetical protein T492DRAFT_390117 [Pavlovales sp. CCMP2436]
MHLAMSFSRVLIGLAFCALTFSALSSLSLSTARKAVMLFFVFNFTLKSMYFSGAASPASASSSSCIAVHSSVKDLASGSRMRRRSTESIAAIKPKPSSGRSWSNKNRIS